MKRLIPAILPRSSHDAFEATKDFASGHSLRAPGVVEVLPSFPNEHEDVMGEKEGVSRLLSFSALRPWPNRNETDTPTLF